MSLKIKTAARLKVLFPGVALSKKTIETIGDQFGKAGLTDESTDEDIDAKLNERNALYSFEDQKKFDDYQAGKASKEAADKEVKRLADIAAGKKPDDVELPADTPEWAKAFMKTQTEKAEALEAKIAAINGDKVTSTRKEQFIKSMEGTPKEYQAKELKKFDLYAFRDDDHFNEVLESMKEDHASAIQEDVNAGLGGGRPLGGAGGAQTQLTKEASAAEVDAAVNSII